MTAADIRMIIPDMLKDVSRPTTSALLLLDFAAAHNVPLAVVLAGTDWTEATLSCGGAEISADSELQLIANTIKALGNVAALGLDMGVRYHLTDYGNQTMASPARQLAASRCLKRC